MKKYGSINLGTNCIGYEMVNVGAIPIQLNVPNEALSAFVVCEANNATPMNTVAVRFREDGINPSSLDGMPLINFSVYEIRIGCLKTISFISADVNTQKLHVQYYA